MGTLPPVVAVCRGWLWMVQVRPQEFLARTDPDARRAPLVATAYGPYVQA